MKVIRDFGEIPLGSREYDSRKTRLRVRLVLSHTNGGQYFLSLVRSTTNGDQKPLYLSLDSFQMLDSFIQVSKKLMVGDSNAKPAPFVEEHPDWVQNLQDRVPWIGKVTTSDLSSAGIGKATEREVKK